MPDDETNLPQDAAAEGDGEPQQVPDAEAAPGVAAAAPAKPAGGVERGSKAKAEADAFADLVLGKDSLLTADVLTDVKALAAEHGLSLAQAQALLAREDKLFADASKRVEGEDAAEKARIEGWKSELEQHLGKDWESADREVTAYLTKYAPAGLVEILQKSGYAYYRPLFDTFRNAAKALASPKTVVRAPTSNKPTTEEEQWARDYPKSPSLSALRSNSGT